MHEVVSVTNNWAIIAEHKTIQTPLFMGDVAIDDVTISLVPGQSFKYLFCCVEVSSSIRNIDDAYEILAHSFTFLLRLGFIFEE